MAGRSRDTNTDQARGAPRAPAVAALDLGQSKVACFIMKPEGVRHADRTIRVAGASHVQSRGVRGGAERSAWACLTARGATQPIREMNSSR